MTIWARLFNRSRPAPVIVLPPPPPPPPPAPAHGPFIQSAPPGAPLNIDEEQAIVIPGPSNLRIVTVTRNFVGPDGSSYRTQATAPVILPGCGCAITKIYQFAGLSAITGLEICTRCQRICRKCGKHVAMSDGKMFDQGGFWCKDCEKKKKRKDRCIFWSRLILGPFIVRDPNELQ